MASFWGLGQPDPPMRPGWLPLVAIGFVAVRDAANVVSHASERMARVMFGFENYALERHSFREQAVRELEAMTEGHYWEVDTEEGVYVASIDEIELEDELDEELEEDEN